MDDYKQDKLIAEFCGFTGDFVPPSYSSNLNTIHFAEMSLSDMPPAPDKKSDRTRYRENLCVVSLMAGGPIHATANLRAEAFLKTIGKWEQ